MNDLINEANNSIEKRTEIVVERRGFRATSRRIAGRAGSKIINTASSIGQSVGGRVARLKGKFMGLRKGESNGDSDNDTER